MRNEHWILCPTCGSKTRDKIREDTVLKNFPLYCPKCKQESLIEVENLNIHQRAGRIDAEPMTCEIPRRSSALFFEKQLYDCSFG